MENSTHVAPLDWMVTPFSARLKTRVSFHQGFYLQQLIKGNNYTTKDLYSLLPEISEYNIKRNFQLYNALGDYSTILLSKLSTSRLWKSIKCFKRRIQFWKIPPTKEKVSCFIKCYKEWFGSNPAKNVYYLLDMYDKDLSHWTQNNLIEQLAHVVRKLDCPAADNLNIEQVQISAMTSICYGIVWKTSHVLIVLK